MVNGGWVGWDGVVTDGVGGLVVGRLAWNAPGLGGGQRLGQAKLGDVGGEEGVRLADHCGSGRVVSMAASRPRWLSLVAWLRGISISSKGQCVPRRRAVVPARWAIMVDVGWR